MNKRTNKNKFQFKSLNVAFNEDIGLSGGGYLLLPGPFISFPLLVACPLSICFIIYKRIQLNKLQFPSSYIWYNQSCRLIMVITVFPEINFCYISSLRLSSFANKQTNISFFGREK